MKKQLLLILGFILLLTGNVWANGDHEHAKEDTDFTQAFKEGTVNNLSSFTRQQDTFYFIFSHNYFFTSLPHGSNPAFSFSYAILDNLTFDSVLTTRSNFEYEGGINYNILNEYQDAPLSLNSRLAYNTRGHIAGFELSASRFILPDTVMVGADYRLLYYFGDAQKLENLNTSFLHGVGFNTLIRIWKHWHLFGDIVLPFDSSMIVNRGFIWSTGLKKRIPFTPHILTLYVGNAQENTLSGRTISMGNKLPDFLKVGFLFSINIPEASNLPERLF